MISSMHVTIPNTNPLHPRKAIVYVHKDEISGDLSLTENRSHATSFPRLAAADLAKKKLTELIKQSGVSKFLDQPVQFPAAIAAE